MSLQVWLPLKGDLKNLGLSEQSIEFPGDPEWANFGKISQESFACKKTTGIGKFDALDGVTNYSIACWVYIDSSEEFSNYYDLWRLYSYIEDTKYAVPRCELRSQTTIGQFNLYAAKEPSVGSSTVTYYGMQASDQASDKWCHMVYVKGDDDAKVYINGELVKTVACSAFETYPLPLSREVYLGQTGLNSAYIQDFRIYDHCLSPKEVKLISQALVCHYPLNDIHAEPTTNLRTWQLPSSGSWDEIWGGSTTVWSVYDTTYEPVPFDRCYKGEITYSGSSGGASRYIQTLDILPSTTYTYSAYIKASDDFAHTHANFLYRYEYPGDASNHGTKLYEGGVFNKANMQSCGNGWYRCWGTFTTLADTHSMRIAFFTYPNKNITYYIGGWMLEQKDHVTPYVFGSRDRDSDDVVYDCSGYCNNGTMSDTTPTIVSDSPRYLSSMEFGANKYIRCYRGGMVKDEITVSAWAYLDDWSTAPGQSEYILSSTQSGGLALYRNTNNNFTFYMGTGENSIVTKNCSYPAGDLASGWHLFTMTYNGLSTKGYVDGNLVRTNNAYEEKVPIFYNANNGTFIGTEAGSNQITPQSPITYLWPGKISDVRIYATALSADDILELYQTSATVDNEANMYAYEFVES